MMNTFIDILSLSFIAKGDFDAYDLIGFDDQKIAADDAQVKGVAKHPGSAGLDIAVIAIGVARVKASGIINAGERVISAAAGGVKTVGAGSNDFATALTTAADGDFLDILIR